MILWSFEHFKTFVPYEIMQQAASALDFFQGESTDGKNPKMVQLTQYLEEKTSHPAWMPKRGNDNYTFNEEGSVFRNKARLFSSFYICVPPSMLDQKKISKEIVLTNFGESLARGKVGEKNYYDYIIKKFKYPHPAFSDYQTWVDSRQVKHPFLLILRTLVELFNNYGDQNSLLSNEEIYYLIQPCQDSDDMKLIAERIIENREKAFEYKKVDFRKIREIMAFLAMSGYVYYIENEYKLNLIRRHKHEKTYYYLERSAQGAGSGKTRFNENIIKELECLWEEI